MRKRRSPEQMEKLRRQAIALLESGLSLTEVALRIGYSYNTVSSWHNRWKKYGDQGLKDKPITGRPRGAPKLLEQRRLKAMALLDTGLTATKVAKRLDCSISSVVRWRDRRDQYGDLSLKAKPISGPPPKLTDKQKQHLLTLLNKGALHNGYQSDLWNTVRITDMIKTNFGVSYHFSSVGRIMTSLGWRHQKRQKPIPQQDQAKIKKWRGPGRSNFSKIWTPPSSSSKNPASG